MPFTIVIGTQWGDEGKGKFVDLLAEQQDIVVRYQGGNNAGHTVVVDDKEYKFHLLPSGVIQGKRVLLASGVVIDPKVLLKEITALKEKKYIINLGIDVRANIIMPYHILLDLAREKAANKPIGTTGRGICPCYEDKVGRRGVTFFDLIDPVRLQQRLDVIYPEKKALLEKVYNEQLLSSNEQIISEYSVYGNQLKQYLTDVSLELSQNSNNKILFEGAQGTFLDVAFGTYPYVTSSHTIAANAFVQAGIPSEKSMIIGVAKAYTTRVGSGPFITELSADNYNKTENTSDSANNALIGDYLRKQGAEYGTTTGRPRRCGWLDLAMLKESTRLNGFTALAITKLDVLSGLDEIKVCTSYLFQGKPLENFPHNAVLLEQCAPVYKTLPGFKLTPELIKNKTLPENAVQYLRYIQKNVGVPINFVSIGPERSQTILYENGVE
ncbi:adenylosuccinate synthase [Candidatus Woesearchaeota archaeon]|nr:adenylosuccinate synthase [Candidatus Woesearchaeota archaeon]